MKTLNTALLIILFSLNTNATGSMSDPTRPSSFKSQPQTSSKNAETKVFVLSAIFHKKGIASAIFDNTLYQVGDSFSGNKIVSINETSVLLKNRDGYRRINLINKFKKVKK